MDQGLDEFVDNYDSVDNFSKDVSPIVALTEQLNRDIQARIQAEQEVEEAASENARNDLFNFHQKCEEKRTKKMAYNRSQEQHFLEQLEAELENENPWERVMNLVDLQTEASDETLNVSRMRTLFIQLKNEPLVVSQSKA